MRNLTLTMVLLTVLLSCKKEQMASQNASPMVEYIRPHERVGQQNCEGNHIELENIFDKPAILFIPKNLNSQDTVDIVFHFHGSHEIAEYASCFGERKMVVITINLGSGSSAYEKPLKENDRFLALLDRTRQVLQKNSLTLDQTIISGFSAGYGAVRAIISNPSLAAKVDGVLLLDGLHTDYQPEGQLLSNGGHLNAQKLEPFLLFAQQAALGNKHFFFTHSSIFPGTYASTTECADYLISELGLKRNPVLEHGPLGMQLLSRTEQGGLQILAFAGNTAPDHMDHLHGMYSFLIQLLN